MTWRDLLFLHYTCEPETVQRLLPPGLTVDTFPDESGVERAWIGLVPFRMERVRPLRIPLGRSCEEFCETNVRTYCHRNGEDPGVWFFSLDAANRAACLAARASFRLNYHHARMSFERHADRLEYSSERVKAPTARCQARCEVAEELGPAAPGTLEFFLIERYLLYAFAGRLLVGQVFHEPYRLRAVRKFEASTSLFEANGLVGGSYVSALFSEGLEVTAGRLRAAGE